MTIKKNLIVTSPNYVTNVLFYRIYYLRQIREFFGLVYKIDVHQSQCTSEDLSADDGVQLGGDKVLLTCTGVGFRNLSRVVV